MRQVKHPDDHLAFIPYPPIERHGVIGDRRTAALVASDGTLDWLCLPDYDGPPLFGALIDATKGGFWRMGPAVPTQGKQHYLGETVVLVTTWAQDGAALELTDFMAWPEDKRPPRTRDRRVILRRLRCTQGHAACVLQLQPGANFAADATIQPATGGFTITAGEHTLGLWMSRPLFTTEPDGADGADGAAAKDHGSAQARAFFHVQDGEEVWVVMALDEAPDAWTLANARDTLDATTTYWRGWAQKLSYTGARRTQALRSALTIHLLGYAPNHAVVAAPTTSLPERLGGDRNYDYRFSWLRDASLSLAGLSLLGDTETSGEYLRWLEGLDSSTDAPLQVVYRVNGDTHLLQQQRPKLAGYRGSEPVLFGNRAAKQKQLGVFGFLADGAWIHLQKGGKWTPGDWRLIQKCATYICAHWHEPDSGIWELPKKEHYVTSKVMCWVVLDRSCKIAERTGQGGEEVDGWRQVMATIHAEVMDKGWSQQLHAFRQYYGAESLDAGTLLIPVMDFLPADHPRVRATCQRIMESLTIDGFVYRFIPRNSPAQEPLPMGEFEGAFLPCTFWMAETLARTGQLDQADAILRKAENIAGELGLFAEEVDARTGSFLGNTPLLFSQVTYVSAALALDHARA